MSGNNIFGDFALAFRRSIGSPMKKSRDEDSNVNPKSQAKGAVHKMIQILPLHVKRKADENDQLEKAEKSVTSHCTNDEDEDMKNIANSHRKSTIVSDFMNDNNDIGAKDGKIINYASPSRNLSTADMENIDNEEILTCTIRQTEGHHLLEKVQLFLILLYQ